MIDDSAIRAALEAVLGDNFQGLPVSGSGTPFDPHGCVHIRTRLIRGGEKKVNNAYTIADGLFEVLPHVPAADGDDAAEALAVQIKPLFYPIDQLLGGVVRVVEVAVLSARPGTGGQGEGNDAWTVCPLQIDWRVDQIGG